ncbi:hypothetical protein [Sneathiella chinensis]|uniref:Uncharacterized protein n=1 Tax=Sneathiella chinensis TaxID=349750 RepID=A0ABQ5TZG4_9PROT|nr:hypothetical protein [Sneathiella chinensis]GLQ05387.1 hypothetical protein GCM10007924_06080 [Sneathiella chinensis]
MSKTNKSKGQAFLSGFLLGMSATGFVQGSHTYAMKRHPVGGLNSDWVAVGSDMRRGMRKVEQEQLRIGTYFRGRKSA